jgi:hypothetical protein
MKEIVDMLMCNLSKRIHKHLVPIVKIRGGLNCMLQLLMTMYKLSSKVHCTKIFEWWFVRETFE